MTTRPDARDERDLLGIGPVSSALLDPAMSPLELKRACETFHTRCLARLPELGATPTQLASGIALSPLDAARCVQDILRTSCFLQAVDAAIRSRLEHRPQHPVAVLYAGCGPLAPLALLLARRYRRHDVHFILVDIHEQSLAAALRLFELAGARDGVRETRCADAATMRLDRDLRVDVLVVEIMQRALTREPQLAVLANLVPQCPADVTLVPARVVVSACLARMTSELDPGRARERVELGTLIELSLATLPTLAASLQTDADALAEIVLQVPVDCGPHLDLMLRTRIEAMPGRALADYDSGLTYPVWLAQGGVPMPGDRIGFRYRLGQEPGFVTRRLDPQPAE